MQTRIYLEPPDRHLLMALLSESGFVPDQLGKALGIYINRLIEIPLANHPHRQIEPNPSKHYQPFCITVTIPDGASAIPRLFNCLNWNDFIYNFLKGNIVPRNLEDLPTIDLPISPTTAQASSTHKLTSNSLDPSIYIFRTTTSVPQDELPIPILPPDRYYDARPYIPHNNMTLLGPPLSTNNPTNTPNQTRYSWYIQDLERSSRMLKLPYTDRDAALLLARHYGIIHPFRNQQETTRLSVVLEALYHKLLVPVP